MNELEELLAYAEQNGEAMNRGRAALQLLREGVGLSALADDSGFDAQARVSQVRAKAALEELQRLRACGFPLIVGRVF